MLISITHGSRIMELIFSRALSINKNNLKKKTIGYGIRTRGIISSSRKKYRRTNEKSMNRVKTKTKKFIS
jgi:hypothetical protein